MNKITSLGTVALSPDPITPPGALFPWLGLIRPTPTSSIPMISGQITPAILHEALRRTPNHKAARPDGVPGMVFKHMPPQFHEALHLLFQALAITGITSPSWLQSHTILIYKKGTHLRWITIALSHWRTRSTNIGPHASSSLRRTISSPARF
jgi:hypothetical protein